MVPRASRLNRVVVYLVLILVSMLLSFTAKRVAPSSAAVATRFSPKQACDGARYLSFSSFVSWAFTPTGNSPYGEKHYSTNSDANSASSDSSGANGASTTAATTTTASHNYDSSALKSLINYNIAVAYQPKNRESSNLFKQRHQRPSPATQSPSGEDNLFVSQQSQSGHIAVGVADGVGGWSEAGYDSSAISRELCAVVKANFEQQQSDATSPKELLIQAYEEVLQSPKVEIGGTTACIGILTPNRKLKVANLGDSWCGLFRDYKLVEETSFQTHNFNTPYQLAKIPPQIIKQAELKGKQYIIDQPTLADEYQWDLQKNDIILFATDGVTDNVIAKDIELFLQDQFDNNPKPDLEQISSRFVKEVVKVSKDPQFPSAFAQELSKLTGQKYMGGKEDDITVVFIKVT